MEPLREIIKPFPMEGCSLTHFTGHEISLTNGQRKPLLHKWLAEQASYHESSMCVCISGDTGCSPLRLGGRRAGRGLWELTAIPHLWFIRGEFHFRPYPDGIAECLLASYFTLFQGKKEKKNPKAVHKKKEKRSNRRINQGPMGHEVSLAFMMSGLNKT